MLIRKCRLLGLPLVTSLLLAGRESDLVVSIVLLHARRERDKAVFLLLLAIVVPSCTLRLPNVITTFFLSSP